MRILIVSNLYPPYYRGGYEIHCARAAEGLRRRGHDVYAVTSTYGLPRVGAVAARDRGDVNGIPVRRVFHEHAYGSAPTRPPWALNHARHQLADARRFREVLAEVRPDVVNWWNMHGLSKLLLPIVRESGIRDVHCLDDQWMILEAGHDGALASRFWRDLWGGQWGPGVLRPLTRAIGRSWARRVDREGITTRDLAIQADHVCFQSRYLHDLHREAGLQFPSWEVIYGGVDVARFHAPLRPPTPASEPVRLLYAGQVSPDRGLHTAVEALGQMAPTCRAEVTLTVAGVGPAEYVADVKVRAGALGLLDRLTFLGKVSHERMPEVYRSHDVLLFTSTRPEGQGFTMVEALLAGCAVATTGSGGAMEVATLAGLPVFPKNDPAALGALLTRLVSDRGAVREIAAHGQQVAMQEFDAEHMIDKIESVLLRFGGATQPARAVQS